MGNYKLFFLLIPLLAAGCSKSPAHGEGSEAVYEGTVQTADYHLTGGKTVVIDDHGESHEIEGFPMLFRKPVEVSRAGFEGFEVEILPASAEEAAAEGGEASAAEPPAEEANPYE